MLDEGFARTSQPVQMDERIKVVQKFICPYCQAGTDHFTGPDVKNKDPEGTYTRDGKCRSCGAAAMPDAVASKMDEATIKKSVLIVAEDDAVPQATEIEKELHDKGITTINTLKIVEGQSMGITAPNLAVLMSKTAFTLMVMSPRLGDNQILGATLKEATGRDFPFNQDAGDEINLVPVWTTPQSYEVNLDSVNLIQMSGFTGCAWSNPVDTRNHAYISKDRLMGFIKIATSPKPAR